MGDRRTFASLAVIAVSMFVPASAGALEFEHQWKDATLTNPDAIDLDAEGIIYVANPGTSLIIKFDPSGEELDRFAGPGTDDGEVSYLAGLEVDQADELIYVTDDQTGLGDENRVQVFRTENGNFVRNWGNTGAGNSQFNRPRGIAVGVDSIFVADRSNHRVHRTTDIGTPLVTWGSIGYGDEHFDNPKAIAVGPDDQVFVGDASGSIKVFSADGQFIRRFAGQTDTGGLGEPGKFGAGSGVTDLDVDSRGYVYAIDKDNFRVQVFDESGAFVEAFGSEGAGAGQFRRPGGIAVGSGGRLFVTDSNALGQDGRIQVLRDPTAQPDPVPDPEPPRQVKPRIDVKRKIQQPGRRVTTLVVRVSKPGRLNLLAGPRNRGASVPAKKAGRVRLTVKPKGRAIRALRQTGRVKLTVKLRFRASNGAAVNRRVPLTIRSLKKKPKR